MKKQIRTIIIATIITIMIIISCACIAPAMAEDHGEFYPRLTIVVDTEQIHEGLRIVYCQDKDGNVWSFFSDENDWIKGDIADLLMWNLKEDEIIEVYWEGYTEDVETFFSLERWR